MIRINDVSLPPPTEYRLTYQDTLGLKQVNALGNVVRDVLGKKRRVQIGYKRMSGISASDLCTLVSPTSEMSVTCPSLMGDQTFLCRLGTMDCSLFHRENGQDDWADVTLVLEEV